MWALLPTGGLGVFVWSILAVLGKVIVSLPHRQQNVFFVTHLCTTPITTLYLPPFQHPPHPYDFEE